MNPTRRSAARAAASAALVLLPLAAAAPALGAQTARPDPGWHEVVRAEDGTTVSIDSASIGHTSDSTFRVRTLIRFPEPMQVAGGRTVDREIDLEELDCGAGRSKGVASGLYLDTAVVTAVALSGTWATVAESRKAVFDASCGWLLGSFAAALPTARELEDVEEQPQLLNGPMVSRALSRFYPPGRLAYGETGNVTVRFRITEEGLVDVPSLEVVRTTHADFSQAALDVARLMVFRPARLGGRAVRVWVTMPVAFRVQSPVFEFPRTRPGNAPLRESLGLP
ncbi:MAG TPA: energy transducer TonB [Longimicrobium sp.]|jgi:TonB family protein|nr:energy transducer TonB [Longimicrobium sp.]